MNVQRYSVDITTATGGGATGYSPTLTGRLVEIIYTKNGTTPFASTADLTVTTEKDGSAVWSETNINANKAARPVRAATTTNGAASTLTEVPVYLKDDRIKIAVAQGGNTKLGNFVIITA